MALLLSEALPDKEGEAPRVSEAVGLADTVEEPLRVVDGVAGGVAVAEAVADGGRSVTRLVCIAQSAEGLCKIGSASVHNFKQLLNQRPVRGMLRLKTDFCTHVCKPFSLKIWEHVLDHFARSFHRLFKIRVNERQ